MSVTELGDGAREHLLAFADDEHLIGQQHAEWIGVAPFLEEDLAFCSIAQDELGHAAALYELLGDADAMAFGRTALEYRSCHLVELPCADWADALARHWLYDLAEAHRWDALTGSAVPAVAALVARAQREEDYHRRHAAALIARMLDAGGDPADRVNAAIARLLPMADAIWEAVGGEDEAVAAGVVTADSVTLRERWRADVSAVAGPIGWAELTPPDQAARTRRSRHFDTMLARITEVVALDPTARW